MTLEANKERIYKPRAHVRSQVAASELHSREAQRDGTCRQRKLGTAIRLCARGVSSLNDLHQHIGNGGVAGKCGGAHDQQPAVAKGRRRRISAYVSNGTRFHRHWRHPRAGEETGHDSDTAYLRCRSSETSHLRT